MGKDKKGKTASECSTCGTGTQCVNCNGTGKWLTQDIQCGHCNGTGKCPINS